MIRVRFVLLTLVVATAAPAVPRVSVQERRPQVATSSDVEDLFRALIRSIDLSPDDRVAASPRLNSNDKEQLRAALDGHLSPVLASPGYMMAPNVLLVNDLEVKNDTALVQVIYGPLLSDARVQCGRRVTFSLRRGATWSVDESKVFANCASVAKRMSERADEELREVFRLAMSQWQPDLNVKFVVGPDLDPPARRVIATVGRVYSPEEVRTSEYVVPQGFVRLDKLTIVGNTAEVVVSRGPVPVGLLTCGAGVRFSMQLRREGEGWAFEDDEQSVC